MSEEQEPPFRRAPSRAPLPDFAPPPVPARASIAGRHVRIKPLQAAYHGPALYRAGHESEEARASWEFMFAGPWADEAAFMEDISKQEARSDWVSFALLFGGEVGGMASFLNIVPTNGSIEIGAIWLSPRLKRTRAATEALYLLLRYAFDLGYRRIEWKCDAANEASRQAARRLGFRHEGIFYRHMVVKGKNRDTAWYSLLDEEWPGARRRIVKWLDDANFDAQGAAQMSLGAMTTAHLDTMLTQVSDSNQQGYVDFGAPFGREIL